LNRKPQNFTLEPPRPAFQQALAGRGAHLGIVGRSAGGLLMGAALTQHPADYRAMVGLAGVYDMQPGNRRAGRQAIGRLFGPQDFAIGFADAIVNS